MRRTQIYLDEQQANRLDRRAAARGTTRSKVIRLAIDDYLTRDDREVDAWRAQWREAVHRSAGIAPGLAGGETYVEDIRTGDAARLTGLEP